MSQPTTAHRAMIRAATLVLTAFFGAQAHAQSPQPDTPLTTRGGQCVGTIKLRYASTVILPERAPAVVLHGRWSTTSSADGRSLLSYGDALTRPVSNEHAVVLHRDGAECYTVKQRWLTGSRYDLDESGYAALVGTQDGHRWEARLVTPHGNESFRTSLPDGFAYRSVSASASAILAHRIDPGGRMDQSAVVRIDARGETVLLTTHGPSELNGTARVFELRYTDRIDVHDRASGRLLRSQAIRTATAPAPAAAGGAPTAASSVATAPPQAPAQPKVRGPVWPLASGSRDVMIEFGTVHFLSYIQGFDYSHKGVDLNGQTASGQLGDQVLSMRPGIVVDFLAPTQASESYVVVEVPLPGGGSEWDAYIHTVPSGLLLGLPVEAGTVLGTVATGGCWSDRLSHHLHIARMTNWQLSWGNGERAPYDHMVDPLQMFHARGDRDPFERLPRLADVDHEPGDFRVVDAADRTGPGLDFAWGSVDLVCEVGDSKSSVLGWRQGVLSIGYWIESLAPGGADVRSADAPYLLCEFDEDWYAGYVVPGQLVSLAHPALQGGAQLCWDMAFSYFLTHASSTEGHAVDVDLLQHWGTDASTSSMRPNGSDNATSWAREIQEARFTDGTYRVHCLLKDRLHQVDEVREVMVDNFRPYLQAVEISGSATTDRYETEWLWNSAAAQLRLTPADLANETVAFLDSEQITIELRFSEPVNAPTLGIVPPLASGFVPQLQPVAGSGGTRWYGAIPGAVTSASTDAGLHRVSVRCVDTNGTPIVNTTSTTPRPAFFNKRTTGGPIVDGTSLDVLHRFAIRP